MYFSLWSHRNYNIGLLCNYFCGCIMLLFSKWSFTGGKPILNVTAGTLTLLTLNLACQTYRLAWNSVPSCASQHAGRMILYTVKCTWPLSCERSEGMFTPIIIKRCFVMQYHARWVDGRKLYAVQLLFSRNSTLKVSFYYIWQEHSFALFTRKHL